MDTQPGNGLGDRVCFIRTKTDFPIIDSRLQGRRNRLTYALSLVEPTADYPLHPDGIIRFDNETGSLEQWRSGYGAQPDEAIFVPTTDGTAEDEGWLLGMVYNRVDKLSELVILEAQDLSKGPIAKVIMPRQSFRLSRHLGTTPLIAFTYSD